MDIVVAAGNGGEEGYEFESRLAPIGVAPVLCEHLELTVRQRADDMDTMRRVKQLGTSAHH